MNRYDDDDLEFYDPSQNSAKLQAEAKNRNLSYQLDKKRETFAMIGTNKAKRRLNKLSESNPLAHAVRLSLEIEDVNIVAKRQRGQYRDKYYEKKEFLILKLINLFLANGWTCGYQDSDNHSASSVIYFEVPECEQISWHSNLSKSKIKCGKYEKEWDGKQNATLEKLEKVTIKILTENKMYNPNELPREKGINFINQKCDYSCGVACAAMVAGVSFEEALEVAKETCDFKKGIEEKDMDYILVKLGCIIDRRLYAEISKQIPHVVLVPSLNIRGGNHYVVIHFSDGVFEINDPQWRRDGCRYYARTVKDPDGVQLKGYSSVVRIYSNKKQSFIEDYK